MTEVDAGHNLFRAAREYVAAIKQEEEMTKHGFSADVLSAQSSRMGKARLLLSAADDWARARFAVLNTKPERTAMMFNPLPPEE